MNSDNPIIPQLGLTFPSKTLTSQVDSYRAPTLSSIRFEQALVLDATLRPTPQPVCKGANEVKPHAVSHQFPIFTNPSIRLPDIDSFFSSTASFSANPPPTDSSSSTGTPSWIPPSNLPVDNFEGPHFSQRRANYLSALVERQIRLLNRFKNSAYRLPGQTPANSKQKTPKTQTLPTDQPPNAPVPTLTLSLTSPEQSSASTIPKTEQRFEWAPDESDMAQLIAVVEAQERSDIDQCHLYCSYASDVIPMISSLTLLHTCFRLCYRRDFRSFLPKEFLEPPKWAENRARRAAAAQKQREKKAKEGGEEGEEEEEAEPVEEPEYDSEKEDDGCEDYVFDYYDDEFDAIGDDNTAEDYGGGGGED